jgi:TetR/AcrR family transcriptional repressor of nem operon
MGRRPGYEVEGVLRAAATLFRANGFHAVSVDDVVKTTGLNRFALYEKFGGKEGLFYATLDYYHAVMVREDLLGPLRRSDATMDSLRTMLRTTRKLALDPELRCGCLIVNASIELGGSDERVAAAADAVIASFREAVSNVLARALARGEIENAKLAAERVNYLVVMIQAFFALAYISRSAADELIRSLLQEVEAWQPNVGAKVPTPARR